MFSALIRAIAFSLSIFGFGYSTIGIEQTWASESFSLSTHCPGGFQKVDETTCKHRSLYHLYPSLREGGVGGLKTGLPPEVRDGFAPKVIDLGRYLFFDPVLSADGTISCATCHQPDKGFSDGRDRSIGIERNKIKRSAPSLWNVAYQKRLFWDARADSLEDQMHGPLFSAEEMGNTEASLLKSLNDISTYRSLFADAFDRPSSEEITLFEVYEAVIAFEASLISLNSRYDQYAHGYAGALTQHEIEGMNVFRSFVARCAECHTPPLFTNQQIAVIGTPEPEGLERDVGAAEPFKDETMRGGFKVPSLRNITKTAPYMHSGRFGTLHEAVRFYTKGRGHAVPEGEHLRIHWHIWEPKLTETEINRIVDFLGTLEDESFMPVIPESVPSGLPVVLDILANRDEPNQ